ncbi:MULTISPECIES: ABC transporter ATP-binding protein [unclassified Crossiella]|uniref:ABC transporter ATP-binding protein n=1 Tax=unclassified Crossiella TaxID=2620835 RepID=UPI001FFEC640|nr:MULTISPECIES: ATP-binding cassette domain-containing protein [unclassified Crossiella]MCK2244761.1 ATP-binding cassette domain-containing protein [Crossiella sp. S99.2]MCK2258403.1 ATP-binding cassette domain-containing protein [Crossiella sp. S99.1]
MIEVTDLVKRYGETTAVDRLSFTVRPGLVTGFLGPNGAGKSTTMRMIVGLDTPTAGATRVNGRAYRTQSAPLREVGVLLDARATHPGRSARDHLLALGATHGIRADRVDAVLELVGLSEVARRRTGNFSLGMGQRLGIAAALLGDPRTLLLDEPVNGLDPDGIRWIRHLLRDLAAEGRTVFVSSHLMSEMALTADHLIIMGRGRLVADLSVAELVAAAARGVQVGSPRAGELAAALDGPGVTITPQGNGVLHVTGRSAPEIGLRAAQSGIPLFELTAQQASLEEAYLELTADAVQYQGILTGKAA